MKARMTGKVFFLLVALAASFGVQGSNLLEGLERKPDRLRVALVQTIGDFGEPISDWFQKNYTVETDSSSRYSFIKSFDVQDADRTLSLNQVKRQVVISAYGSQSEIRSDLIDVLAAMIYSHCVLDKDSLPIQCPNKDVFQTALEKVRASKSFQNSVRKMSWNEVVILMRAEIGELPSKVVLRFGDDLSLEDALGGNYKLAFQEKVRSKSNDFMIFRAMMKGLFDLNVYSSTHESVFIDKETQSFLSKFETDLGRKVFESQLERHEVARALAKVQMRTGFLRHEQEFFLDGRHYQWPKSQFVIVGRLPIQLDTLTADNLR